MKIAKNTIRNFVIILLMPLLVLVTLFGTGGIIPFVKGIGLFFLGILIIYPFIHKYQSDTQTDEWKRYIISGATILFGAVTLFVIQEIMLSYVLIAAGTTFLVIGIIKYQNQRPRNTNTRSQ